MKLAIVYKSHSCVTGRKLLELLRQKEMFRRVIKKRTDRRFNCDVLLRWGSTDEFSNLSPRLELNTLEGVRNATNKLRTLELLRDNNVPHVKFTTDFTNLEEYKDGDGNFYVRGSDNTVRYDNTIRSGDKYVSAPVKNKRREYRVHVFNGRVISIYEKIPNEENTKLYKSYNCSFKLRDPENCRLTLDNQLECIKAVNSLGLLFGGVDVIRDKNCNIFICEVNSSPALNDVNINRWVDAISEYVQQSR